MRPTKYPTFVPAVDCNGTIGGGWIDYGKALCSRAPQAQIEGGWNSLNTGVVVPGGPQHRKEREPRMRKTNHVPWMGRTVGTAIRRKLICLTAVAALAFGALMPAPAVAQNDPVVLDNVMYWWDHLDCPKMVAAVNAIMTTNADTHASHPVLDGVEAKPAAPFDNTDAEREWCHLWSGLGENQQRAINYGAKQPRRGTGAADADNPNDGGIVTAASSRVFDKTGWWDGLSNEGRRIAIGDFVWDATGEAAGTQNNLAAYASLTGALQSRVTNAYMALMGDAMPTTTTDAPALPIFATLMLGGVLAGRGWWLRRRA